MKYIVGNGKALRERVRDFPPYYFDVFRRSKILVLCVAENGDVVAGCGINSIHNTASLCVKEKYRGKGFGRKTFETTISVARRYGLNFLTGASPLWHNVVWHLDYSLGFREIVRLEKYDIRLIVLPLTFKGKLLYAFAHLTFSKLSNAFVAEIVYWITSIVDWYRKKTVRAGNGI